MQRVERTFQAMEVISTKAHKLEGLGKLKANVAGASEMKLEKQPGARP
jgi:hypothetical protein